MPKQQSNKRPEENSQTPRYQRHVFVAGEDIFAGDFVGTDPEDGLLYRCELDITIKKQKKSNKNQK